jgi:hypothetical protein
LTSRDERLELGEGNAHCSTNVYDANVTVIDQFVKGRSSDAEYARSIRDAKKQRPGARNAVVVVPCGSVPG